MCSSAANAPSLIVWTDLQQSEQSSKAGLAHDYWCSVVETVFYRAGQQGIWLLLHVGL